MDNIKLSVPKKSEYIGILRLIISSLGSKVGVNIDEIDDLKILVSEICIFFIKNVKENTRDIVFDFILDDKKIIIEIADLNSGDLEFNNDDLSILIIESLADAFRLNYKEKKALIEKNVK